MVDSHSNYTTKPPRGGLENAVVYEARLAVEYREQHAYALRRLLDAFERLAIDAVRMRTKLPYELYKEVVLSLRARSAELYPAKIDDYLDAFPRRDSILAAIEKEIF